MVVTDPLRVINSSYIVPLLNQSLSTCIVSCLVLHC